MFRNKKQETSWEIVYNLCIIWACSFLKFVQNWIINLRGWSFWSIHRWLWDMCFEYPITFKVFLPAIDALHPVSYRKTSISFHPATSFRAQFIHEKHVPETFHIRAPWESWAGLHSWLGNLCSSHVYSRRLDSQHDFSPYGLFWEDFWNCSESVPFYGTAYFRHDFNTENWLENCGFTKHSCDLDPAVIEAMGVSTVAAKPVWSWARKDVKNIFIYFHVYRFKHALVKVMSCESLAHEFWRSPAAQSQLFWYPRLELKVRSRPGGATSRTTISRCALFLSKRRASFACLRQPLYWHRKKIQIHRAPNGASIRVLLLNRVFFLFHKEKAQFIP